MSRVVLKLSGEALLGKGQSGIHLPSLQVVAAEIKRAARPGIQLAIVVGGGNIWRGARDQGLELGRTISDNMGMLATLINALALQDVLERIRVSTRVLSAIDVSDLAEPYIRRRAIRHLEKGRVVVFAAGTGNPYFSTDTAAALRASEIDADLLVKATQVEGVYSADPKKDRRATFFRTLTLSEALRRRLAVMDATAMVLCRENKLPIRICNMHKPGNIAKAVHNKPIGTLVVPR